MLKNLISVVDDDACILLTTTLLIESFGFGEANIVIDPFLSDYPSRDKGWNGYLTGKSSTQGGDR